jgi:hypothetical protein
MKKNTLKTLFGSLAIGAAIMAVPVSTFAANATSSTSIRINGDGIVHIINAEVTSISGNIINAVARLKNNLVNFSFTTNASTTISTKGNTATSSSAITLGDRLKVTGTLASIGSTIGINATTIKDVTKTSVRIKHTSKTGTLTSVNTSNGTFVLTSDNKSNKSVTVQTNATTTFISMTGTTTVLSAIPLNTTVKVTGTLNADGTVLTATTVTARMDYTKRQWMNLWKNDHKDSGKDGKNDDRSYFLHLYDTRPLTGLFV